MSSLTNHMPCRHDPLTEHDPSRIAIVSITQWLQLEWKALDEKFGSAALKHLPELAEKTPEFLKKFDELTALKQQDVEHIQQLRGQIQQALKNREGELGDLDTRYSEKATEIQEKLAALETELANKTESCNMLDTQNEEAQRSLAIIEAQMAEQKEASKNHQSELRRLEKTVQTETTRLAMLTSECGTTDKRLTETREQILKAKESLDEERRSMNERVADYNRQITTRNAQIDQTSQGLEDREDQLTQREQQFNATSAQTEEAQIRGKQELEDDRMALQSERKKLQDDIEKAQHQWDVMWDYRNSKDGQVSNANEKADNLRASVAQHEEDRRKLQAVVRDRDSKLQEQSKNLTKANHSLDSMTKSRNDLAAESKRQLSQLQAAVNTQSELKTSKKQNEELTADKERLSEKVNALEMLIKETGGRAAAMHSLHSHSMTSMNTLNDNITQMFADQTKQILASLQESAEEKTELISRVKDFEEVIIPRLKEQLGVAEGELEKAKEDSNATIEGLRTESGDLRVKLSTKEKKSSECNTMGVLIASPVDKAALEKCRAEHSDVDALRGRITQINREMYDLKAKRQEEETLMETTNSKVLLLEAERNEAFSDLSQAKEKLKTAEETIRSIEAQMNRRGQEHIELVTDYRVLEQKHQDLQRLHIRGGESLREAHQSHREQQDRLAIAERAKDAVQSELADLKRQVDSLTRQLHSTEAVVGNAQQTSHDYKNLLERYEHLRDRHETVQHLHEDAMRSLREANRSLQDRKRDLQTAQRGNEAIQTELDRSKVANGDLEQQITLLTEQLNIGNSNPRKRTHNQMSSLEPESHVGRVGDWGLFPDPNTDSAPSSGQRPLVPRLGQQTSLTRGRPIGAPIDNFPIRHVYPVADVSAENFGDGRVPATVVDKLRSQVKAWNKKKPTWTGSDKRRCANSFAGKKTGDWKERHGCDACADKGLICVAVCHDTIELLPLKDAGEISPSGEGYWFRRTDS